MDSAWFFVVILAMCVLVVDMLNVFFLVTIMEFNAYRVGISKTFVYLTRHTLGKFVSKSLGNVFNHMLVFYCIQLGQKIGPTSHYMAHFTDVH